jgi:chromosome segregation ATPase
MEIATIILAVAEIAAAFGAGFLLGYYVSKAEAPALKVECNKLRSDIEALSTELRNATASLSAAREENASLAKRVAGLTRHYLDQTDRVGAVEQQRNDAEVHSRELESEVARLKERGRHLPAKSG